MDLQWLLFEITSIFKGSNFGDGKNILKSSTFYIQGDTFCPFLLTGSKLDFGT